MIKLYKKRKLKKIMLKIIIEILGYQIINLYLFVEKYIPGNLIWTFIVFIVFITFISQNQDSCLSIINENIIFSIHILFIEIYHY